MQVSQKLAFPFKKKKYGKYTSEEVRKLLKLSKVKQL